MFSNHPNRNDNFRPITEGYQPNVYIGVEGYHTQSSAAPKVPSGGSNVTKASNSNQNQNYSNK